LPVTAHTPPSTPTPRTRPQQPTPAHATGDVAPADKQLLFVQKLHLCAFTFDFTDPTRHVREKEVKRQTLLELVDYANSGQGKFTEAVSEDIVFMLSSNLFRTLPPSRSHDVDNFDPEEEEPTLEPAWPHLQVRARVGAGCCWCEV
jgi:serine/threonine-protein phosphatase 2A regulatory subunit B'